MPKYDVIFRFPAYDSVVTVSAESGQDAIVAARAQELIDPKIPASFRHAPVTAFGGGSFAQATGRGGARPGAGNPGTPRTDNPRTVKKQICWTVDEWARVEALARATGQSVTDYQRGLILKGTDPVFIEGVNAGYGGKPKTDNPYDLGSRHRYTWLAGWRKFGRNLRIEK